MLAYKILHEIFSTFVLGCLVKEWLNCIYSAIIPSNIVGKNKSAIYLLKEG